MHKREVSHDSALRFQPHTQLIESRDFAQNHDGSLVGSSSGKHSIRNGTRMTIIDRIRIPQNA
jgi:hypothetical protein